MSMPDRTPERTTANADPTTPEEFEAALADLIRRANRNGVNTDRPWDCRSEDADADWMVEISQLAKPIDD